MSALPRNRPATDEHLSVTLPLLAAVLASLAFWLLVLILVRALVG
jgi:hypothetical protein